MSLTVLGISVARFENRTYSTEITRQTAGNLPLHRISVAITLVYYTISAI